MGCIFNCCCCMCATACLAAAGILIAFKIYTKLTTGIFKGDQRLEGKTVIVTGANTGIGKETARNLAQRGARVILACRDLDRGNTAKDEIINSTGNTNVVMKMLDLGSLTSVREFANEIIASESHLDVLINNAGAAGMGNVKSVDGLQLGMQVNHFGPFLLTNLLVDLLKKSSPSRIIFVSSKAHKYAKFDIDNMNFTRKYLGDMQVYHCSKLANVLNANELAKKLKGTGVTVNSLHPGAVHTDFLRRVPTWVYPLVNFLAKNLFKTAEEGAQTTIYLAVSDQVKDVTGKYFAECKEADMSAMASDEGLAKKVWEKSEECVKMKLQ